MGQLDGAAGLGFVAFVLALRPKGEAEGTARSRAHALFYECNERERRQNEATSAATTVGGSQSLSLSEFIEASLYCAAVGSDLVVRTPPVPCCGSPPSLFVVRSRSLGVPKVGRACQQVRTNDVTGVAVSNPGLYRPLHRSKTRKWVPSVAQILMARPIARPLSASQAQRCRLCPSRQARGG